MTRFKGTFNWHGELHTLWTTAESKEDAFKNFITRLAEMLEKKRWRVNNYFMDGSKDNWKVKEVN